MRSTAAALLFLVCAIPAHAASCDIAAIQEALESSTDKMKPLEIEALEQQSTEGGVWRIFREKDGRVHSIIRIDAGESGRNDLRLSAVSRAAWGIADIRTDYIRHAFADNGEPFADVKKTTRYYYYCNGKLHTPSADWGMAGADYEAEGQAVKAAILDAKEVAAFTKGFAR